MRVPPIGRPATASAGEIAPRKSRVKSDSEKSRQLRSDAFEEQKRYMDDRFGRYRNPERKPLR